MRLQRKPVRRLHGADGVPRQAAGSRCALDQLTEAARRAPNRERRVVRGPGAAWTIALNHKQWSPDAMIEDGRGRIDYDEAGAGPTVVLVPGSWGTRSAWREV